MNRAYELHGVMAAYAGQLESADKRATAATGAYSAEYNLAYAERDIALWLFRCAEADWAAAARRQARPGFWRKLWRGLFH